ncbi:FHA domain-containing protein [Methylibium sp.]|uniref:FHA domain-containing protein n=1 Tax=Methylibium sp. TaxID=2067992 RepID=UPI003D12F309
MSGARLGLIELLDRDGGVAHRLPVMQWPVTIGRALDCDVVLDDPHAAPRHATIEAADGEPLLLCVGESRNGLRLAGRTVHAGERAALGSGAEWQIGRSRLRLRLAGEVLAPELPWTAAAPVHGRRLLAGLVLLLAWVLGEHWLQSDPGDPLSSYLPVLVGTPVMLGVWCFLWALGSKLFTRHFDYLAHLQLALGVLLVSLLLDAALPLAAFALSLEGLARAGELITLALGCGLVWGHLSLILPTRRQALAVGFATMFVVGAGLKLALNQQRSDRWFAPLYLSTLGPPALRLAPTTGPQQFIDEARALRQPLEKRARDPDAPSWLLQADED